MNVFHWSVWRSGHHHILRLQVLVHNAFGVTISDRAQGVLHDLHNPTLVGAWILSQVSWQAFDEVLQIPSMAGFHDQIEVALILEVLKDAQDVWMVKLLEDGKFLAHLVRWRSCLVSSLLAYDLTYSNDLIVCFLLKPVAHKINRSKGALSELLLRIIDVSKSLCVLLEELLTPIPVTRLTTLRRLWGCRNFLSCAHEAEKSEDQSLKLLLVDALVASLELVKEHSHLLLRRELKLKILQNVAQTLAKIVKGQPATLSMSIVGFEWPLSMVSQSVLALHQVPNVFLALCCDRQPATVAWCHLTHSL
mmetsp:Transcript_18155/g.42182  ORF Transcript_18155/g.42182 Transcript_18155/m.42182 type:complete len:306 (-) Transcript_18155:607-1524(-)